MDPIIVHDPLIEKLRIIIQGAIDDIEYVEDMHDLRETVVMVRPSAWVLATRACSRGATKYSVTSERMIDGNEVVLGCDLARVVTSANISYAGVRRNSSAMDSPARGDADHRRRCSITTRTSDSSRLTNAGMRNLPRPGFRFTLMVHGGVFSGADDGESGGCVRVLE